MSVGVIVPVRGFAPYLAEALDAILANAPDEVVVVDDGSFAPVELPTGCEATLVRREVSGGPAAARATGLKALGDVELIALCDADDAWQSGHLDAARAALEATGAGWSFGRARIVGPDGLETGETWSRPAAGVHPAGELGRALYVANPVPTSSVVLRADAVRDAGGFAAPVRVAEDWELWLRLCAAGVDAVCVESEVRYRRRAGSLTADVAGLAEAQLEVHRRHAGLVDAGVAAAAVRADRATARRARLRARVPLRRRDPYRR